MASRVQLKKSLQKNYNRTLFANEILKPVFQNGLTLLSVPQNVTADLTKRDAEIIDSVVIYGKISLEDSNEVTLYEITLKENVRIELSRVAIGNYIRKLLLTGDSALVNFISKNNNGTWRLTFISKDSKITEKGIKEKTTNTKRYTYLLGPAETCKTAAERFEILSGEKTTDTEALKKAFSVEKLGKDFFNEYKVHYDKFIKSLKEIPVAKMQFKDEKDLRDFVKKLLGRIVFLWFVQKKGWLGATSTDYKDGDRNFIINFFIASGGNESFYPAFLCNLFFDTLNNSRRDNDNFVMPDGKIVKIPFLNGGLFDKEDNDEKNIVIKPSLFHSPEYDDDPKDRGFFDFLNAYNFTIYEDSPDDQIVAVDPEMLGHIFENLLEDNKDKGAFYTPKEIVHYMCRESLIEYLAEHLGREYKVFNKITDDQLDSFGNETRIGQLNLLEEITDKTLKREDIEYIVKYKEIAGLETEHLTKISKLLDSVKICDPAIGSGAFPMGLLQEIFAIKEVISYETNTVWKPAEVKENIIQNSIYGVDIEKGAVDIARLRFWLSLVVDEKKPKALPNLDYKIVVGDSLISKFEDEAIEITWEPKFTHGALDKYSTEIKRLLVEITQMQRKYFNAKNDEKKILAKQIREAKLNLLINQLGYNKEVFFNTTMEKGGFAPTDKDKKYNAERELQLLTFDIHIDKLKKLLTDENKTFKHFDWKLDFPEVLNPYLKGKDAGFDIIIGNPPYVNIANISDNLYRQYLQENYSTVKNKCDLYSVFIEKARHILILS
ncbi:MAG: hypothetical protein GXX85_06895 [Ignavibacteria bacterium]|nr:hypothetical protein [Ignavibacteria bacterium]